MNVSTHALLFASVGGSVLPLLVIWRGHTDPAVAQFLAVGGMSISLAGASACGSLSEPARRSSARGRVAATVAAMYLLAIGGESLRDGPRALALLGSLGLGESSTTWFGVTHVLLSLSVLNAGTRRAGGLAWGAISLAMCAVALAAGRPAIAFGSALCLLAAVTLAVYERRFWTASLGVAARLPRVLDATPATARASLELVLRLVGLSFMIRWAVGGVLFWLALPLLAAGHAYARGAHRDGRSLLELLLVYLLVLGVGVSSLWGFVGHYFMSDFVAQSVGWPVGSPFQKELAFYHLGFGVLGVSCLWVRDRFWLATGAAWSIFLFGAASVHLTDYLAHHNTSVGNWGFSMLFGDLLIPSALLALLALYWRLGGWEDSRRLSGVLPVPAPYR